VKTFFAIALNCVYLTLAVGVAKTTHYCMGRENTSTHFTFDADPCICYKLMGDTSGCCAEESVLLQVDDDQTASAKLFVEQVSLPLLYTIELLPTDGLSPVINTEFVAEQFLRPPPEKVYLKHRSLII
jgi:hypothetical protein